MHYGIWAATYLVAKATVSATVITASSGHGHLTDKR